jgi:cytochrome c-type biogenesis protein CcmH
MNKKIRRAATMLLASWVCLTPLGNAFAVLPEEVLSDPALEARARVISQDLRCLVCQNQSIDDSNAPLAKDLRMIVRERLTAGDTDKQVFDYVVVRYGNYVLLKPPLQSNTFLLWAAPFIMLLISLGVAFAYLRKRPALEDEPDVSNSDMKDE